MKCRQQNLPHSIMHNLHLEVTLIPMHFIMMDLISKFKSLLQEHQYALTVADMLSHYTWRILICTKGAEEVVYIYLVHIYFEFGSLHKIFSCFHKLLPLWEWNRYLVPLIILRALDALRRYIAFRTHAWGSMSPLNLHGMKWFIHPVKIIIFPYMWMRCMYTISTIVESKT